MVLPFDKDQSIESPALAPGQDDFDPSGRSRLTIALVNNMPDSALKATERQFMRLVETAAGAAVIRFHCFSLPSVKRSLQAHAHIEKDYTDIADLSRLSIDGLIVTGAEPNAEVLLNEPFWRDLSELIEWAKTNTRSAIWSCLAAHAAVLHLDGIERRRLGRKCSGIYNCVKSGEHWLTRGLPSPLKVAHSRVNAIGEDDLASRGYQILTRSERVGVDIFARKLDSQFIFFQGHPEYDALSLQREYMRDLARFLAGERDDYPAVPDSYFDPPTEAQLASFRERALVARAPTLAAELPGLTLRPDIAAGLAAKVIFRNWIGFLADDTKAVQPASQQK
jgi:homoserine O-succinyltransferase/O-acetyltransferase